MPEVSKFYSIGVYRKRNGLGKGQPNPKNVGEVGNIKNKRKYSSIWNWFI